MSGSASDPLQLALGWQVTLWSGEVTAEERSAFERWLHADLAHAKAWQQVQRLGLDFQALPKDVAAQVLRTRKPPPARRGLLRGLGWLAGSGVLALAVRETPVWQAAGADYRTARGERRDLALAGGTSISLNTATAIDLRDTEHERRVALRGGEILVSSGNENGALPRPLIVETAAGALRARGARFAARHLDDAAGQVQVFEGAVEVRPRLSAGAGTVTVAAGEQARFTATAVDPPSAGSAMAAAWVKGLLVAERQRLADFLAELARYRPGLLRCDPAVADLAISGVYPLADTDAVLQSLAQALPVRVRMSTRYLVTVTAR